MFKGGESILCCNKNKPNRLKRLNMNLDRLILVISAITYQNKRLIGNKSPKRHILQLQDFQLISLPFQIGEENSAKSP